MSKRIYRVKWRSGLGFDDGASLPTIMHALMFGQQPKMPLIGTPLAFDTGTYKKHLCAKFLEQGIVEANLVEASTRQKIGYDMQTYKTIKAIDPGWLSTPIAGS